MDEFIQGKVHLRAVKNGILAQLSLVTQGVEVVHGKIRTQGQQLSVLGNEGADEQLQHLIRAVARQNLIGADPDMLRIGLAQAFTVIIGIAVELQGRHSGQKVFQDDIRKAS